MKVPLFILGISLHFSLINPRFMIPIENVFKDRRYTFIRNNNNLHFLDQNLRTFANETEVMFYFKSRLTNSKKLTTVSIKDILNSDFNPSRRTMFIIHGYLSNKNSPVNVKISQALLQVEDWNIFVVDWQKNAYKAYDQSVASISNIGNIIAKFIKLLLEVTGATISSINLCGFSLGAHIAGHAGRRLNGEVETIVGLDPAAPLIVKPRIYLNKNNAKFVQIIHTNTHMLGTSARLGHADFYPNGGDVQNGCNYLMLGICSHSRSYLYFAESILNDKFRAKCCESKEKWENGFCDNNLSSNMGGNVIDRIPGTFYLNTASEPPYALG